jgi:hypothetical protein
MHTKLNGKVLPYYGFKPETFKFQVGVAAAAVNEV